MTAERDGTFRLEEMMGFNTNRTAFLMREAVAERFRRAGYPLAAQEFGILYRLWRRDGITHSELAELMRRDRTTITRRVDALARKGMVERRPDPDDRRVLRVHLTPAGRRAEEPLVSMLLEFHDEALDGISPEEREITIRTLKRIAGNLAAGGRQNSEPEPVCRT